MKDVMIDIETLGTTPNSVILSIAAVQFDRDTGETGSEFLRTIDPDPKRQGRKRCQETYNWWQQQSEAAMQAAFSGTASLHQSLNDLYLWFNDLYLWFGPNQIAWSQGTDFDFGILDHAFRQYGFADSPWKYNNKRDTRTVYDICDFDPKSIEREGDKHNALDDCKHQIRCVVAALRCVWVA